MGAGVSLVQIREKKLTTKQVFELTQHVLDISKNTETRVLVNERFDISLAAAVDGVHLTSNSLPIEVVRNLVANDFIIGVSTHSLDEVRIAKDSGADFATFGPVFDTLSKEMYDKPKGLEALKKVCDDVAPFPVIALGGISADNYESVLDAGARGFAAITFLNEIEGVKKLDLRVLDEK